MNNDSTSEDARLMVLSDSTAEDTKSASLVDNTNANAKLMTLAEPIVKPEWASWTDSFK